MNVLLNIYIHPVLKLHIASVTKKESVRVFWAGPEFSVILRALGE